MNQALQRIHNDLEAFIKKYYLDLIIRGSIYALVILTLCLIGFATISYFGANSIVLRTSLFYIFASAVIFVLVKFILIPSLALFKIGRKLDKHQAAKILGNHFPEVSDRLTNLLDLEQISSSDASLVLASIEQKAKGLNHISFTKAVELKANWKTAKLFVIPILLIAVFIISGRMDVLSSGTESLIAHRTVYQPVAPFNFQLQNQTLTAIQSEPFEINLKITGDKLPEKVYLIEGDYAKKMDQVGSSTYRFVVQNPSKPFDIHFSASNFKSKTYTVDVLAKPMVTGFKLDVQYPEYLKKENETFKNQGDIAVPEGSVVFWILDADNTKQVEFNFNSKPYSTVLSSEGDYRAKQLITETLDYNVTAISEKQLRSEEMSYQIKMIPDAYPTVEMKQEVDSSLSSNLYFTIKANDDYGFSKTQFVLVKPDGTEARTRLKTQTNSLEQRLYHFINLSTLSLNPGDELQFYAEVWDNDGVNGPKYVRTNSIQLKQATKAELESAIKSENQKIKDQLKENKELAKEVKEDLEKLSKALLDKKKLSWEEKQQLEKLLAKQKKLKENIQNIQKANEQKKKAQNQLMTEDEELLKKQAELEDLMNKVLDEETLKMMEEMQKMLDELNKDKLQDALKDWEKKQESLEDELDRNLELFKRLEVEQELSKKIDELEELAEKQDQLAEDETKSTEEKAAEQEKLNEEFDELTEELKDIEKKNEELEDPLNVDNDEEKQEEIKEDQKESSDQLNQKQEQKAKKKQKDAAKKMQEMAEQMNSAIASSQAEQQFEDMENLRQLLDNLVNLSEDQESLSDETREININNPRYIDLIREQNKLKDDSQFIADSLQALAKRVAQISKPINKELDDLQSHIDLSIADLAERNTQKAGSHQQFAMTAANNLALLLSEVLQQMQDQMANQMPGNQNCQKPGGKKPNPGTMKKLQQQLQNQKGQMEKMLKEGMKPGQKPGGKMSKDLAKMAAQQEAIRQQLEKMAQEQGEDGTGSAQKLREAIEKMEKNEEDLLNRELNLETIKRQEEILTRLLEAENAERERKQDEKRESNEAVDLLKDNNKRFEEYQELKRKQSELLKSLPPSLNEFYKRLSNQYLNQISDEQ